VERYLEGQRLAISYQLKIKALTQRRKEEKKDAKSGKSKARSS
jgi:hypothetical protein